MTISKITKAVLDRGVLKMLVSVLKQTGDLIAFTHPSLATIFANPTSRPGRPTPPTSPPPGCLSESIVLNVRRRARRGVGGIGSNHCARSEWERVAHECRDFCTLR